MVLTIDTTLIGCATRRQESGRSGSGKANQISRIHFFDFSDFSLFVGGLQIFRKYSAKALGYSVVTSLFLLQNFFRTFH